MRPPASCRLHLPAPAPAAPPPKKNIHTHTHRYTFFEYFPAALVDNPINPLRAEEVAKLTALLASDGAKEALQRAVNRGGAAASVSERVSDDVVSVYELRAVFDGGSSLADQVARLI